MEGMDATDVDWRYQLRDAWTVFYLEDANHSAERALNEIERQGGTVQSVQHVEKLPGGSIPGIPGWIIVAKNHKP